MSCSLDSWGRDLSLRGDNHAYHVKARAPAPVSSVWSYVRSPHRVLLISHVVANLEATHNSL